MDNKAKDIIIVVMQRLHVDDLVGHLLQQDGWYHLNLPAIAEEGGDEYLKSPLGKWRTYYRKAGEVLHAKREPREVLDKLKHEMGSLNFAAQY